MQTNFFRAALLGLAILSSLFIVLPSHAQSIETVGYSFCSQGGSLCTDGDFPDAGLVQGTDGSFYGTTSIGGTHQTAANNAGTVFRITSAGVLTTLYNFCSLAACGDGALPNSPLIQGTDGNFYGTTSQGGPYGGGTVFKMTPAGALLTLYSFCRVVTGTICGDGVNPTGLIQGKDGNLYGTTEYGGVDTGGNGGPGTVFRITPSGAFTTIYSFCNVTSCLDGLYPNFGLLQGADGNFYGTTTGGGAGGAGTFFEFTPAGALTTLYSFCTQGGSSCTDGGAPGKPIQGKDENFYGTTALGGANNFDGGTVFKLTPAGVLTTLYSFCSAGTYPDCTDGENPGSLIQAANGNFYGITEFGGTNIDYGNGGGTVFQVTPTGTFTNIYNFCALGGVDFCTDGLEPIGVIQGTDGNFYGTTASGGANYNGEDGGANGGGTVFKLALAAKQTPTVTLKATPNPVAVGQTVTLTATVSGSTNGTPTGYVDFTFQGAPENPVELSSAGVATLQVSTQDFQVTTYPATVTYLGSSAYNSSSSTAINVVVSKAKSGTALAATPNPAQNGQTLVLTATVSGEDIGPTGTVTFSVGSTTLGTASLALDGGGSGVLDSDAQLSASTNVLAPGTYPVVATYSGDGLYNGSQTSAYNVVIEKAMTTTTVSGEPNPVTPPANVTLIAAVRRSATGAAGVPTGTVTFYYQTMTLGSGTLNEAGEASITASTKGLPAGTYPITVKYSGDTYDAASTSSALSITVN